MDTLKHLKLKSYLWNMIIGVTAIMLASGILQAIALEVLKEFDPASIVAYICGAAACGCIILYGLYEMIKAFTFERRLFKGFEDEKVEKFYSELEKAVQLTIPGQIVVTKNYLLLSVKGFSFARVIPKENLVGCFQTDLHHESEATECEMMLYDDEFKATQVKIRGKGCSAAMNRLVERIIQDLPWIYYEDYDGFLTDIRRSGFRRKVIKQMHDMKMRYETGYDSDIEAENEMLAMSQDVKEKLDSDSFLKRFLNKSE